MIRSVYSLHRQFLYAFASLHTQFHVFLFHEVTFSGRWVDSSPCLFSSFKFLFKSNIVYGRTIELFSGCNEHTYTHKKTVQSVKKKKKNRNMFKNDAVAKTIRKFVASTILRSFVSHITTMKRLFVRFFFRPNLIEIQTLFFRLLPLSLSLCLLFIRLYLSILKLHVSCNETAKIKSGHFN